MKVRTKLCIGEPLELLGPTVFTILEDDGGGVFTVTLERIGGDQEEVKSPARQAGPEDPLQGCDCQALPVEGSIGGLVPLPDAVPDKAPEVQGVRGHTESHRHGGHVPRWAVSGGTPVLPPCGEVELGPPRGGLTGTQAAAAAEMMKGPLHPGIAAWGSLDKLVADAIAGGATTGTLAVTSGDFRASASWKDGMVESAYMSKKAPDREP